MKNVLAMFGCFAVVGMLSVACGSSDDSGSTGANKCGTETAACTTLASCVSSACSSEASDLSAKCPGLSTCQNACACGDSACFAKCSAGSTADCEAAGQAYGSCEQTNCASQEQACSASQTTGAAGATGSGGSASTSGTADCTTITNDCCPKYDAAMGGTTCHDTYSNQPDGSLCTQALGGFKAAGYCTN